MAHAEYSIGIVGLFADDDIDINNNNNYADKEKNDDEDVVVDADGCAYEVRSFFRFEGGAASEDPGTSLV
jgi:hypothetical protein